MKYLRPLRAAVLLASVLGAATATARAQTPPSAPAPSASPGAVRSATDAPTTTAPAAASSAPAAAVPVPYERFVTAADRISPLVYDEISPGNDAQGAFALGGGFEFPAFGRRWMLEGEYGHASYDHRAYGSAQACAAGSFGCNTVVAGDPQYRTGLCPSSDPGCVTVIGYPAIVAYNGLGQAFVPAFRAHEDDVAVRLGYAVANPRVYVGLGGFFKHNDFLGYPTLSGVGAGVEKLPDLDAPRSLYANVWYYPNVGGTYTYPNSTFLGPLRSQTIPLSYAALTYRVGATIGIGSTPFYVDLGYAGQLLRGKTNAPSDTTVSSPFVGLGYHL